jgi:hypothetical protein
VVLHLSDSSVLLLFDQDRIVDRHRLEEGEMIQSSMVISFPCHKATLGDSISFDLLNSFNLVAAPSLDFNRGLKFEENIWKKFGHLINFSVGPQRREFILVISFGRARFLLDMHTVIVVLQAFLGGLASH